MIVGSYVSKVFGYILGDFFSVQFNISPQRIKTLIINMKTKLILFNFTLSFLIVLSASERARYDNYRVYEILIESNVQLQLMKEIENYPDGVSFIERRLKLN